MFKLNPDHSTASEKSIDFSAMQAVESRWLASLESVTYALSRVDWFIEVSPLMSPSPSVQTKATRQRVLFDHEKLVWPFVASLDALPLDSNSVPAVLIRHAWHPKGPGWALEPWLRVLKPGGWLIALSANPWHPSTWGWQGRQTFALPSWPHFVWAHTHPDLTLDTHPFLTWARRRPRFGPLLTLVGRKNSAIAPIKRHVRSKHVVSQSPAPVAQCRAA